jgi:hypothetical protein
MQNKPFLFILFLFLFIPLVLSDSGPKPTVKVKVTIDGQPVLDDAFYSVMMDCEYKLSYEPLLNGLYSKCAGVCHYEEWKAKCKEMAIEYGFKVGVCADLDLWSWYQHDVRKDNLTFICQFPDDNACKAFSNSSHIYPPDDCFWVASRMVWGGNCELSECTFGQYLPTEFRLATFIPSKNQLFVSNAVQRKYFNSIYALNLSSNGSANLMEIPPSVSELINDTYKQNPILPSFFVSIIIELLVALIFLSILKLPKKILLWVLIANIITLPLVWFFFPLFGGIYWPMIIAEIFAFIFEALFIYFASKKALKFWHAFLLSFIMNLFSFLIGSFLLIHF